MVCWKNTDHKQKIMGYEQFYKIKERPFTITPDPKFFYPDEPHMSALEKIKDAVDSSKGLSVIIGDTEKTLYFTKELFEAGVFVNAFVRPGVPPGLEMLRTSYMASHEDVHLDKIVEIFGKIGKQLGVIL